MKWYITRSLLVLVAHGFKCSSCSATLKDVPASDQLGDGCYQQTSSSPWGQWLPFMTRFLPLITSWSWIACIHSSDEDKSKRLSLLLFFTTRWRKIWTFLPPNELMTRSQLSPPRCWVESELKGKLSMKNTFRPKRKQFHPRERWLAK